jgi:hypothetical protein
MPLTTDPLWRELEAREATAATSEFLCPECRGPGICLHVVAEAWFVCDDCRVKWYAGHDRFLSWRFEGPHVWTSNRFRLFAYREV